MIWWGRQRVELVEVMEAQGRLLHEIGDRLLHDGNSQLARQVYRCGDTSLDIADRWRR